MAKKSNAFQTYKTRMETCLARYDKYMGMVDVIKADAILGDNLGAAYSDYSTAENGVYQVAHKSWLKLLSMAKDAGYEPASTMVFAVALQGMREFIKEL